MLIQTEILEKTSDSSNTDEQYDDSADRVGEDSSLLLGKASIFLRQYNIVPDDLPASLQELLKTLFKDKKLEKLLNKSLYGKVLYYLLEDPTLEKLALWPFLTEEAIKNPDISQETVGAGTPKSNRSKHMIPRSRGLLINGKSELNKVNFVTGFFEGARFIANRGWGGLLITLFALDIYNYVAYPTDRYGNTPLKIFLGTSTNEKSMEFLLRDPRIWPPVLLFPAALGLAKAIFRRCCHRPIDEALLDDYQNQSSIWRDVISWLPAMFSLHILPKSKMQTVLDKIGRELTWNGNLPPEDHTRLVEKVQKLARQTHCFTRRQALATLAILADGISLEDYKKLNDLGIRQETNKILFQVRIESLVDLIAFAKKEVHDGVNQKISVSSCDSFYAHYLLWQIGQPQSYMRQLLFWPYVILLFYFKVHFLARVAQNIYGLITHFRDEHNCEYDGKIWKYFNSRAEWNCSVCGDLPLFYRDIFTEKDCWNTFLKNPQSASDVIKLIQRFKWQEIDTIDFTRQLQWSTQDWVSIFDNLTQRAKEGQMTKVQTLIVYPWGNVHSFILTSENMQSLSNFLKNSSITRLDLAGTPANSSVVEIICQVLPQSLIEILNFKIYSFGVEGATALGQVLNRSQVVSLDLSANGLWDAEIVALSQGFSGSKVRILNLSNNYISNGIASLEQGLPGSSIQILTLDSNRIDPIGMRGLCQGLSKSQVKELSLNVNEIGEAGAIELGQILNQTKIEVLSLRDNEIGDFGVSALGQGLANSGVQSLDLFLNKIGNAGAVNLGQGIRGSKVKTLNLRSNSIGAIGAEGLGKGLAESQIEDLNLSGNEIKDGGAISLGQGLPGSQVQTLYLGSNQIGDRGAKGLGQGLSGSQVHILSLSFNIIGSDGVKGLGQGLRGSRVEGLFLSDNRISDLGATNLGRFLNQSRVQELDLEGNQISAIGITGLSQGLVGSQVQILILNRNPIGDKGASSLGYILNQSQILTLGLHICQISDEGAIALGQGLPGSKVQFLWLWNNEIGPLGAAGLGRGLPGSEVQYLGLENNQIGDIGASGIGQGLPGSRVQDLNLLNTGIKDEGASGLGQGLRNSKVRRLLLRANQIGSEGAIGLGKGLKGSEVQELDIGRNNISNAGVRGLASGLAGSHVRILDLERNGIDDSGAEALAQFLTNAQINQPVWAGSLTSDAKKAIANAVANTPLEHVSLVTNHITATGAIALCRVLPQTEIPVDHFKLSGNLIDESQVNPSTCFISEASSLQPPKPLQILYHYCQAATESLFSICHAIKNSWFGSSVEETRAPDLFGTTATTAVLPVNVLSAAPTTLTGSNVTATILQPASNNADLPAIITVNSYPIIHSPLSFSETTLNTSNSFTFILEDLQTSSSPFTRFATWNLTGLHTSSCFSPVVSEVTSNIPALIKEATLSLPSTATEIVTNSSGLAAPIVGGLVAIGFWAIRHYRQKAHTNNLPLAKVSTDTTMPNELSVSCRV